MAQEIADSASIQITNEIQPEKIQGFTLEKDGLYHPTEEYLRDLFEGELTGNIDKARRQHLKTIFVAFLKLEEQETDFKEKEAAHEIAMQAFQLLQIYRQNPSLREFIAKRTSNLEKLFDSPDNLASLVDTMHNRVKLGLVKFAPMGIGGKGKGPRIRKIGNAQGIILPKNSLETSGLAGPVVIQSEPGRITIVQPEK